jgi:hypothetical protein
VNDSERPFGFQVFDLTVGDCDARDGVHNSNCGVGNHQFGSNPNQVGNQRQNGASAKFNDRLASVFAYKDAVQRKKAKQQVRHNSPGVVASGSKSFFHMTIIAGVSK